MLLCVLYNPWHHTNTLEWQTITSHRCCSIWPAGHDFTDWLHKLLLKMLKSDRNQGSAVPQTGVSAGVMQTLKCKGKWQHSWCVPIPSLLRFVALEGRRGFKENRWWWWWGMWGVSSTTVKNSFISTTNLYLSRKVSNFPTWFSPFLSFQMETVFQTER